MQHINDVVEVSDASHRWTEKDRWKIKCKGEADDYDHWTMMHYRSNGMQTNPDKWSDSKYNPNKLSDFEIKSSNRKSYSEI